MKPGTDSTHPRSPRRGHGNLAQPTGNDRPPPQRIDELRDCRTAQDLAVSNGHQPEKPRGRLRDVGEAGAMSTPPPRHTPRRPGPDLAPAVVPSSSSASPQPQTSSGPGGHGSAAGSRQDTAQPAGDPAQLLFTPAQAAAVLQVRESWLRRRAARRQVPCAVVGKHLRFSRADLEQIAADAARPAATTRPTRIGPGAHPRRPGRPRGRGRTDSRRPDTPKHTHSPDT